MPIRPSAPSRPWPRRAARGACRLLFPALAVVAACCLPANEASAQPGSAASKDVERALVDLLARRPELVRNAMDELQRREALAKEQQSRQALKASAAALHDPADAIVLGNPAGDVTLVEFIDYHCGYCKRLSSSIDELIRRDGRLRVLVKHLPILGPESVAAAQLAVSVGEGPAASQVHARLLAADSLDAASLQAIALQYQLKPVNTVDANRALGEVRALSERLGIQCTPAIVVGDTLFSGAVGTDQLAAAIDAARRAKPMRPRG